MTWISPTLKIVVEAEGKVISSCRDKGLIAETLFFIQKLRGQRLILIEQYLLRRKSRALQTKPLGVETK